LDTNDNNQMYNEKSRRPKGMKAVAVINDYLKRSTYTPYSNLSLIDIGCSTGYMTKIYGENFETVIGTDIDVSAVSYAKKHNSKDNITYQIADSMNLPFQDNCFDVATCLHIYEHVPDSEKMISEIYRVLKPNGFCLFLAGNRFVLIEPHYRLPLLSAIPKPLAHHYLRVTKKGEFYYENLLSYWKLKKLVNKFEVIDYTLEVIKEPGKFHATEMIAPNSRHQKIYIILLRLIYWISPTYIWILAKK